MRQSSRKFRLKKGVAVGSTLLAGVGLVGTEQAPIFMTTGSDATLTAENSTDSLISENLSASSFVPAPPKKAKTSWSESDSRRFQALATKRALSTVSDDENEEFSALQLQRRAAEPVSSDEMIAEWQRRRFVSEILDVLSRNVRFFKAKDQTEFSALRDTSRA